MAFMRLDLWDHLASHPELVGMLGNEGVTEMLFKWLEKAILRVEGSEVDEETFESAYFSRYQEKIEENALELGWEPENLATAYGSFQILGENLARYHGLSQEHLGRFLTDSKMQKEIARKQFYIMLKMLIKRRGLAWPHYLFSMWNAGINFNADYDAAIRRELKRG